MSKQWFIGVTHQQRETYAKKGLNNQGFETYLPLCVAGWTGKGKLPKVKPFLPSYIFIGFDPVCDRWRAVFSTHGMRSILCSGERPQAAADWIIEDIKAREVDGLVRLPPKIQCKFKKGDHVNLKGSPVDVLFEEIVDAKRAVVFLSLLNRPHKVIVPMSRIYISPFAPAGAA